MIDRGEAQQYFHLKGHALLAQAFDLSEQSYQRLFDDGLIPLDALLKHDDRGWHSSLPVAW